MEAIDQESIVAPGDIEEAPVSMTTTEANLTGNWKFFRPYLEAKLSPCQASCPLRNDIASYLLEVSKHNFHSALNLLRRNNPLPAITGRVCPHFCQQQCNRISLDREVCIGDIELYLGDLGLDVPFTAAQSKRSEKVAVVGSGPAGLAAAYFLAREGVRVSIFEQEEQPGGLLRYGIPSYRLPRDILSREIDNLLQSLDIELICNQELKPEQIKDLLKENDFVFCAPGLGSSFVPENFTGLDATYYGLELLNKINKGFVPEGNSFAVVGGGNVAVDVARCLHQMDKEVKILYRRSIEEMPAYVHERQKALQEGIEIVEKVLVDKVRKMSSGLSLDLRKAQKQGDQITAGEKDQSLHVHGLILAVGQKKAIDLPEHERIFTGGDYKTGASTVVEAMASGKAAVQSILTEIDPSLIRSGTSDTELPVVTPDKLHLEYCAQAILSEQNQASVPTEASASEKAPEKNHILREAERCLHCGTCTGCGLCWFFCPDIAVSIQDGPKGGKEVRIDTDHCKGCGLCAAVCPRGFIELQEEA